jgi:hypothetical protein
MIYSMSAFSALCFCVLLFKIRSVKNSSFFVQISLMLMASQIFYALYVFNGQAVYEDIQICSLLGNKCLPDWFIVSVKKVALNSTLIGLYWQFYCSAHWIFAMKYWEISYRLGKGEKMLLVNIVYYLVLFLNFAIPVYLLVLAGTFPKDKQIDKAL